MSFSLIFRMLCMLLTVVSAVWYSINRELQSDTQSTIQPEIAVADSFPIGVKGNRFQWNFTYPGPDGILNTADDKKVERMLRIPSGKTVSFHLSSDDYVYILGIPVNENGSASVELIREIAVPDLVHHLEYQSDSLGSFDLLVDPLCGFKPLHDPLMGRIEVTDDCDYRVLLPRKQPGGKSGSIIR